MHDQEHILVVWPQTLLIICVGRWPALALDLVDEDLGLQKLQYLNFSVNQFMEVVKEQEAALNVVLILRDVIYNDLDCSHLVASQGTVDGVTVEVLVLAFLDLVLVEDWESLVEETLEPII